MVDYRVDQAGPIDIARHLSAANAAFVPPLDQRVEITAYARKLASFATRIEAWDHDRLVGLVAGYWGDPEGTAFISNVSVLPDFLRRGIARELVERFLEAARRANMQRVALEVDRRNVNAIRFYEAAGFTATAAQGDALTMTRM